MKKVKILSLVLCLSILLSLALPASAAAVLPDEGEETTPFQLPEPTETPFGQVCVQHGCRTIEGMVPLAGSDKKLDTAQAAFLYEVTTGTVVYSYYPDVKVAPGNLTKIVNAAVVMEHAKLDEKVKVTGDIHRRPAGTQHAGLRTDEELTVRDLLYSMLLTEANDSAIALALHVAGNQQGFTTLMNQWVAQLGCKDTRFGNVHGLDNAECYTTAREMVKIYTAALQNVELKNILSSLSYEHPATNKNEAYSFRTHNYMIDEGTIQDFMDDRVKSGVVSFNKAYGASIVVHAEAKDMTFIAVIFNANRTFKENGWSVISWGNFNEMTELINFAIDDFKKKRIVYDGMAMSQFSVNGGECDAVGEARIDVDSVVPASAHMDNLVMNFSITDGMLKAPVKKGDVIATVEVEYRGSVMTEAEVYAMGNVERAGKNDVVIYGNEAAEVSSIQDSGFLSTIGTICVIGLGVAAVYLAFNAYMRNRIRARRRKRRADRRRNY